MKKLLLLASLLLITFSAHATTVVAEDTAEHTINFTFGRPTADAYLCAIQLFSPLDINLGRYSTLDTITFPNGDQFNGDISGNNARIFTRESTPLSSTLHLGSANYGTQVVFKFCHDLQVPSENPGGQIDTFYKITTPSTWSYFTNAQVKTYGYTSCPDYDVSQWTDWFDLASNAATDYTLISSTPFSSGALITSNPPNCFTMVYISEWAGGPRPSNETSGNVTVGVKNQINFN